ncbi:MAG: GldG family protein [Deltaproteobacteria bacterium]|nr:GldG family protein [Deltaproteobacteria bacterium]NND30695.1 GldG family protein [Myxococcales bacterium]MBT8466358.1 GldG family protein [Deltaproteobacteria bacterium]MBT8482721.1 GldG family protein [Deltaproteobacteria bacterium]NNK08169.1 GldG family protein [Myxococcales bacterium]
MSSNAQKRAASESLIFLLIVGGILILLNVLAAYFPSPRIDLTQNRLFSLAEGSERLAANLDDRLEVTAYFTENLPPPFNATERQVRDLLAEYAAASNGRIIVRFVNPNDEAEQEAARADGIQRVAHQKIEEDQVAVVEGYRGMVLRYLDQTRTIPVIQDTTGLEYMITSAIKELVGERKPIGVVGGHGGPSLEQGLTSLSSVLSLYEVREVDATQEIDPALAALLIIGPQEPFSDQELRRIDQFVVRGGSLGVFGGSIAVDLAGQAGPSARALSLRLDSLLGPWGVRLSSKLVADAQCSRAPMAGPMGLQVLVPYPPIPVLQLQESQREHPVMFRLAAPMLPFVAPLELGEAPANTSLTVLASSSQDSWTMSGETISLAPRNPRDWQMSTDAGPFDLMVAVEGKLPSAFAAPINEDDANAIPVPPLAEKDVRVLVVGTGSFLEDAFMPPRPQQGDVQMNAALALALNAVDWLAADSDLIAIRAKTTEEPALDIPDSVLVAESTALAAAEQGDEGGVESALAKRRAAIESWDAKKLGYRWVNTIGIPFLVALFGLLRWRQRLNKKRTLKL